MAVDLWNIIIYDQPYTIKINVGLKQAAVAYSISQLVSNVGKEHRATKFYYDYFLKSMTSFCSCHFHFSFFLKCLLQLNPITHFFFYFSETAH